MVKLSMVFKSCIKEIKIELKNTIKIRERDMKENKNFYWICHQSSIKSFSSLEIFYKVEKLENTMKIRKERWSKENAKLYSLRCLTSVTLQGYL